MFKYLLDTNIVIYVMKKRPIEVMGIFNQNANRMAISAITFSELQHGAEKSARVQENLNAIEEFASLEKNGQTIGVNDLHIAAHARSEGLVLVTNNMNEFVRVPGLLLENWVSA